MPLYLQTLNESQFNTLPREQTVFLICLSPFEGYGPHLPIGAGLYEAHRFSELLAHQIESTLPGWQTVFFPPVALGVETESSQLAIRVRPHVLKDYLVDSCQSLIQLGFKHFVCVTGSVGPQQLTVIEEAGKIIQKKNNRGFNRWRQRIKPSLISIQSALIDPEKKTESPFWNDPPEHGGKRDTSLALMLYPELLQENWSSLSAQSKEKNSLKRWLTYRRKKLGQYWGNPAQASKEEGARLIQERIDFILPKLRAVWEGARSDHLFKSWYSLIPIHWSLFRAWILTLILFVILSAWVFLFLQSALQNMAQ